MAQVPNPITDSSISVFPSFLVFIKSFGIKKIRLDYDKAKQEVRKQKLKMKNVLITGASRGIGLELARQELAAGSNVFATCRSPEQAKGLVILQELYPKQLSIWEMDVESEDSIQKLSDQLLREGYHIDLLYNNAGIIDWRTINEVDAASMEKVYKVNVVGALLVLRNFRNLLSAGNGKMIINVSSRLGSIALRGHSQLGGSIAYSASKAALNMLTKQASIDFAEDEISVISISPGWVRTDMGGPDAKYSVEESVERILHIVGKFTHEDSGKFFGENGEELPW